MRKNCIEPAPPSPSTRPSPGRRWIAWHARFALAFLRFLRSTTGTTISLLFVLSLAAQDAPRRERVRFIDGRAEICEVLSADLLGVTLRLEGVPKAVAFPWWQLDPADAGALRDRHLGKSAGTVAPAELPVDGLRVRTLDGKTYEGIALAGAPPRELWLKNADGKFVVPVDSIAAREEVKLAVQRVYSADELLGLLVGRARPATAEEADRLGAQLLKARLQDRALAAFRLAEILRNPDRPESVLYRGLAGLRERVEAIAVRRSVFQAQESWLLGDYDAALGQIEAIEKLGPPDLPGEEVLRELRRLRAQIQGYRNSARDERIVQEWDRTVEAWLKGRAMDRALPWDEARAWVEQKMAAEVLEQVRRRANFSPDDPAVKLAWDRRAGNGFKHSYDEGSWIVLGPDSRDPKVWWEAADDAARYKVLKGLYVEKHRKVLQAEAKSCPACGGTGLEAAGAVCPACLGLKSFRVLIYR